MAADSFDDVDRAAGVATVGTRRALAGPEGGAEATSIPLRVAQLVTTMARGGAQITVLESAQVNADEIEMTILSGADRPGDGDYWNDQRLEPVRVIEVNDLRRRLSPWHDLQAFFWLVRWLRADRPDVLHTHSTKAGVIGRLAARMAGVPVVHTVHGWAGPLHQGNWLIRNLVRGLEATLARLSDRLIVVGHGDRELGLRLGIGSAGTYRVIRSGVDVGEITESTRRTARHSARQALGVGPDDFVVGMVARFAPQKDHRTALAAFEALAAEVPAAVLVLIGDGPDFDDVVALVNDLDCAPKNPGMMSPGTSVNKNIQVLGHRSDASRLAAGFDVGLLTSFWEGVPRSLVEAAAWGVPMVATNVGSVADIVEPGRTGFLVAERDGEAVRSHLLQLYSDPGLRARLGAAAAERAQAFSVEQMRFEVNALWHEVAAG